MRSPFFASSRAFAISSAGASAMAAKCPMLIAFETFSRPVGSNVRRLSFRPRTLSRSEDCKSSASTVVARPPISSSPSSYARKTVGKTWPRWFRCGRRNDLFPIRAKYPGGDTLNIGLNYLSADEPQWFTLADVLASKVLTGRTPEVIRALRFRPKGRRRGLKPIDIAGQTINPATDDFYQRLIIHRNAIKAKLETASAPDKPALKSDEQAIKILANATSYGIFVELNVGEYVKTERMVGYGGRPHPSRFKSQTSERPGAYFHPLLATLITGAARLMLALAEHQVVEQGLDWVFCDTDSLAIGNTRDLPPEEFVATALRVREWFKDLNPYGEDNPILQLEKVNFPPDKRDDLRALDPPFCLTISAKRYVLFNRQNGSVVVRKASGHGLGHLMAPYDEPPATRRERIERIGVPLWQEDLWKEIIRAAESR